MSEVDKIQVKWYLLISLIYSTIGIPANLLSLTFFIKKNDSEHISRTLFILLNTTDLFVCICFILLSVSYISLLSTGRDITSPTYCSIVLAIFPTAQQLAVFITAVFCLVRTLSIVKPLLTPPKRVVLLIITLYFLLLLIRVFTLFKDESLKVSFIPSKVRCGWTNVNTGLLENFTKLSLVLVSLIFIPSIVGCAITIYSLKRPHIFPVTTAKRDATITVVILTIICVLSSSTFVTERILRMCNVTVSAGLENIALQFAYSFTCVANPVVYFTRLKRLRVFAGNVFMFWRQ